jgi:cyclophilin family peptidyl-prolyl cis-trans isomerase
MFSVLDRSSVPGVRLGAATLVSLFVGLVLVACGRSESSHAPDAPTPVASATGGTAIMETDKGTIEIELLAAAAPKTVENFKLLAQRGYYNGLTFHRIVKGFMIQGGDPLGDGHGGESAWGGTFADEIDRSSPLYQGGYKRGQVAMANMGPNTNTSQFFIMHQNYPLAPGYTIFGQVKKGIEVVDALADTPTKPGPGGEPSTPVVPPKILKVTIRP